MVVNLSKLTSSAQRIATSACGEIGRSMGTGLRRGGAALVGYLDDPEAAEQVVRAVAAAGALLATLLRARDGGAGASGYQHRRAVAEQVIRDISAVGALLALALQCPRAAGRARWESCALPAQSPREVGGRDHRTRPGTLLTRGTSSRQASCCHSGYRLGRLFGGEDGRQRCRPPGAC
jgi:hypothetical protein